ncbi:threonine/homoserine efflux transporter RhtA [Sphaerotilus hippei]|uniref:Threonine/homoserine efflux transporter RhtA n=2 Tax=Sphaerotilus hippei TaxID=744406 RepID=A0A318GUY5_9BURK|nr:threonine/homoserine efflux transporter RhtA [Sphaerotilus hippei]
MHRPASHPVLAVLLVVLAVASFASLDTSTKLLTAAVPVTMLVWWRFLFQAGVALVALRPRSGEPLWRTRHPWLQGLRGLMLVLCTVFAYFSLRFMPMGEFTAILMLTPLLITVLAAISLGERVSWLRWLLVLGGLGGALIVIRPSGADVDWALLLPLGLVVANALYQILTSRLAGLEDLNTTHFYTGVVGAALASLALPWTWQALPSWQVAGLLLLVCLFSSVGHFLLIQAYARAPAGTLTPYLYFQIVFATLGGWVVFGHVPDRWSLVGIAVIGACGVTGTWIAARENRRRVPA